MICLYFDFGQMESKISEANNHTIIFGSWEHILMDISFIDLFQYLWEILPSGG